MKLKASVDYGIRTVLYLAVKGETCSSREISEEMCVPRDYLIQLALRLRNSGIIKARPGKNGGYVLAKEPAKITVLDIMDAFDSDLKHVRQPIKRKRGKKQLAVDSVIAMHTAVAQSFNQYLNSITVQTLLDNLKEDSSNELIADALVAEADRLRA